LAATNPAGLKYGTKTNVFAAGPLPIYWWRSQDDIDEFVLAWSRALADISSAHAASIQHRADRA
jgi:hypothetical protein